MTVYLRYSFGSYVVHDFIWHSQTGWTDVTQVNVVKCQQPAKNFKQILFQTQLF